MLSNQWLLISVKYCDCPVLVLIVKYCELLGNIDLFYPAYLGEMLFQTRPSIRMGFYLPSEVSRLVLSYLIDHDLQETYTQFLEECPFLQELRQVHPDNLGDYTRVNDRSLMDILREYKGDVSGGGTNIFHCYLFCS